MAKYSPSYARNLYFTPTNTKRLIRSPDHMIHQYETMEDGLGIKFRDSQDFAVHSSENDSMRHEFGFGFGTDSEMKLKFS